MVYSILLDGCSLLFFIIIFFYNQSSLLFTLEKYQEISINRICSTGKYLTVYITRGYTYVLINYRIWENSDQFRGMKSNYFFKVVAI
jgi:hypothetical protein